MSANITIMGNIGKAPETRINDNGTLIATFSMASNTVRKTAQGQVKQTDWFRVTAFGKQAETLARYVQKGSRLFVLGRLTFNPWLGRDGEPQVSADVVLQEFQFVPDGRRGGGEAVVGGGYDEGGGLPATTGPVQEVEEQAAAY